MAPVQSEVGSEGPLMLRAGQEPRPTGLALVLPNPLENLYDLATAGLALFSLLISHADLRFASALVCHCLRLAGCSPARQSLGTFACAIPALSS